MKRFTGDIARFFADDKAATMVEYGLITALIAVGAIAAFTAFGTGLENLFGANGAGVGNQLDNATSQI
ncbi:MAG: Flp family type IVb pilin [Alphaproteobacteria bacterium]|nr:Flp family type IVb pilin [Alphaproteobacteria bacterium]